MTVPTVTAPLRTLSIPTRVLSLNLQLSLEYHQSVGLNLNHIVNSSTTLESLLKRDRAIVVSGIILVSALAWLYLFYLAHDMQSMRMDAAVLDQPLMNPWGLVEFSLTFVMWAVMMIGMMLPSAAPMILLFATVNRKRSEKGKPFVPTAVFALAYIAVWAGFSLFATSAQWVLQSKALLSQQMASTSPVLGGVVLLGAGVFQWTSLKRMCLTHCRTPLDFLMFEWREGRWGAFVMGLRHGFFCLGCCWVLMALLFVTGVMNLLWVAIIAAVVLVEKAAPSGLWIGRVAGLLLIAWGVWMVAEVLI